MSVINQMLRDLDARAASEQERSGLPPLLRPLPPKPPNGRRYWQRAMFFVGALILGAVLYHYAWVDRYRPHASNLAALPPIVVPPIEPMPSQTGVVAEAVEEPSMHLALTLSSAGQPQRSGPLEVPQRKRASGELPPPAKPDLSETAPQPLDSMQAREKAAPRLWQGPTTVGEEKTNIAVAPAQPLTAQVTETATRAGLQALQQGNSNAAEEHFRRAIEVDPRAAAARQALLAVLIAAQRHTEARALAEEGIRFLPQRADWALIAARLQYEAGEREAALATLERHLAHAGRMADYHGFLAFLLDRAGRRHEAVEQYRLAVALKPGEGRWWYGLGVTLESLADHGGAREAFRQALASGSLPQELATSAEKKAK